MAGYLGTKAVLLSTTAADVIGNAEIGGNLTVGGNFTSTGIDVTGTVTADGLTVDGGTGVDLLLHTSAGVSRSIIEGEIVGGAGGKQLFFTNDGGGLKKRMQIDHLGDISFYEDTGTTPKFFWDASAESLGIGTSSPNKLLHLKANTPIINLHSDNASSAQISFTNSGGVSEQGFIKYEHAGDFSGSMQFRVAGSERMRIDASGNVLVGTTTSSGSRFQTTAATEVAEFKNTSGTGIVRFRNSVNSTIGYIQWSGSSTSYVTSSDYRLKTDAQPMAGASARIQALKPVNFEWIADGTRVDGFLAHEAQAIVPEAVTGSKDAMRDEEYEVTPAVYEDIVIPAVLDEEGNELEAERTEQRLVTEAVMGTRSVPDYQGIDQSKLIPLLTAALQEALTKIDDMETRLAALEAV